MSSNPVELAKGGIERKFQLEHSLRHPITKDIDWTRDLVEHSRDLLCIHDLDGRVLSVNPVPARLLGYSVEEVLQMPMRELIDPKFHHEFDSYLQVIASAGEATGILAVLTRTGERRYWEYHCTLRIRAVEKPLVRGIAHDVTERLKAEKSLRQTNRILSKAKNHQDSLLRGLQLFRTLLDQSNDAIEVVDPGTLRLLDVNEKACATLGYTRDELLSMTIFDIDPFLTPERVAKIRETLENTGFKILEGVHRRKDGTIFPVEANLRHVQLDKEYVVAVSRDITERRLYDGRLQEYERVLESLDEMITVVNRDHRYVLANRAFLRYRGMSKEQIVGRHITEVLEGDCYEMIIRKKLDEAFRGQVVDFELTYTYPQVGERNLTVTYLPVAAPDGVARVAVVLRDITDRKRAATLLENSEKRFRLVHDRAPVGIAVVDAASEKFLQVNPKFCEIVGRTEQEMLQLGFNDITHPADRDEGSERCAQLYNSKVRDFQFQKRYLRPDDSVVWVNLSVAPMGEPGDQACRHMAIAQDITEQRLAEEALRESEERLRLAQQGAHIGTYDRNILTGENRWTPEMEKIYGLPPGSAPRTIEAFIERVYPEDRPRVSELMAQSLESGEASGEWRTVWPDGNTRWISGRWRVIKDASGTPVRLIGSDYDITDRKRIEEELREAKEKLTEEKLYLEQEIVNRFGFEEIIGESEALKTVMESVGKVADSDATVLLLGETGTGKELVARAIHRLSHRTGNAFIKMNCAAIPSGLLESELFGNEKGAFTGAVSKKIGRLELADKGTIFLDEIGEISLSLQPKLLRVLQDQEFERLGGTQTLKIDFRLIAATNRDLAQSVRDREFRSDLFYRLNVFPIFLPPLRERRGDIPLLVEHFVRKISRRMKKSITSIPRKTMSTLTAWSWPGNVRELENFIERSLILSTGSVLNAPLSELRSVTCDDDDSEQTLEAAERRHILHALRESNGQISGPRGAAARLGLKRTTLQSKLKHLGINPRTPSH